jgi:hypothetical protein
MMSVASLCALLAVASGVSLNHKAPSALPKVQTVGQTLLLEVQQKLDAGLPVDQLEAVIGQVKDRISLAQVADSKQHTQRQENCTIDKARYTANIAEALQKIIETKNDINAAEAEYDRLSAAATRLEEEIKAKDKEVEDKMEQIEDNRKIRASQHAAFVDRSMNVTEVIATIEQIRGFKMGSTLKEIFPDGDVAHNAAVADQEKATADDYGTHKDEHKDEKETRDAKIEDENEAVRQNTTGNIVEDSRYHTIDAYAVETAFMQLSALAKQTEDGALKEHLLRASKNTAVLTSSDQSNFFKLMDELLEMLRQETDKNIRTEKTAALDHVKMENLLTEELRTLQLEKRGKQDELQQTYRAKRDVAAEIASLRNTLDEWVQKRDDNRKMLADRTDECDLFKSEFDTRSGERDDELTTLSKITKILNDRIKSTINNNDRLKAGTRTTAAPTPTPE